jgi:hypothetical protein
MAALFFQSLAFGNVQILPADTTAYKTLFTAASATRIYSILVNSTDTAAKDLVVSVQISGTDYPLATFAIPLRSGDTNAAPAVQLLNHAMILDSLKHDTNGNHCYDIPSGAVVRVKVTSAITAAKVMSILLTGESL